jgi:hypothetical protein
VTSTFKDPIEVGLSVNLPPGSPGGSPPQSPPIPVGVPLNRVSLTEHLGPLISMPGFKQHFISGFAMSFFKQVLKQIKVCTAEKRLENIF